MAKEKMTMDKLARMVQKGFGETDRNFKETAKRFDLVEGGLREVKADVVLLKQDVKVLKSDVEFIKKNTNELLTSIDKYISLYEEQKLELSSLAAQFHRLEERVAKLERG